MKKPNEIAEFLNWSLKDLYRDTNLRVFLQDDDDHSSCYGFYIEDSALNCEHHVLNVRPEVLDTLAHRARILTGMNTSVMNRCIVVYNIPYTEVH
ncbi:hypothetical protein FINN_3 [Bacillus phage Finn]|uniref:Uncharacterized protein n=1 Tax=Bacillus phage Finn TaxID=2884419 RepID=M1IEU2_9CAUD|nr:hypothetical protein FINN_3 [Bacillus phage Finn]AGE60996.1 hypothetical protein FINN_3 [Bacillus phage Finn]